MYITCIRILDQQLFLESGFFLNWFFPFSFCRALYTIPGNTPMFWQKVSSKVGTRTAEECQFQHQGQIIVSSKKDPSAKKGSAKEKKDPGRKGTLHVT